MHNLRRRFWGLPLVTLAILSIARAQTQTSTVDKQELIRQGADQALAGRFDAAARTFSRVIDLDPQDTPSREALQWTQSTLSLNQDREALRRKTFNAHIDAAGKLMARNKWTEALRHVAIAKFNTLNAADVQGQPWLPELVAKIKDKIAEYRQKREWLEALALYNTLGGIFEGTPEADTYNDEAKFCEQRAHFKVSYKKDGEWKQRMADIEAGIVPEVFKRISEEYVREPDFKAMLRSGIKSLRLLAEMKELSEVFPQLGDEERVHDFLARLGYEETRINDAPAMSWKDWREALERFKKLLQINNTSLKLPESVFVHEFLDGAMSGPLDDFTTVIYPTEVPEFRKHTQGEFAGVGIQITKQDGEDGGYIRVETPLDDTPAYEAGFAPGDLILAVDGKSIKGLDLNDCVRMITGTPDTKVTLTVRRPPAEGTTDITLTRKRIQIVSVKGFSRRDGNAGGWDYMIDPKYGIGYVRVSQFTEKTVDELKAALRQLRKQDVKGLILDLRWNPGGLLTAAVQTCELFLEAGDRIVKTEGRKIEGYRQPAPRAFENSSRGDFADIPLLILVNEQSASASEIVSGTLAGNGKACIVGERTFGKGSVQNLYPLDEKSLFKITTAKYFVPADPQAESWHCLHREPKSTVWGVEPNIPIKLFPQEIRKVFELRRRQDVLKGRNQHDLPKDLFETVKKKPTASSPASQPDDILVEDEAPDRDPQLDVALSVIRLKVLSRQPWVLAPRPAGGEGGTARRG